MSKCIYTAEIGINHNGSMENVFKMIDLAVKHGFDYVKFQKRDINSCYTQEYLDSPRESPWGKTQRDQKLGLELSFANYEDINAYCKEKNIGWYYSPWDIHSAFNMERFNCDYVKIAKACLTNKGLAKYYEENDANLIISINNSNFNDRDSLFTFWNCGSIAYILNCVSLYPSPDNYNGLDDLCDMASDFDLCSEVKIGYSNHSPSWVHPVIASYVGAEMIEVHITLDKNMYGSDQKSSLDDSDLTNMMKYRYTSLSNDEFKTYMEKENEVLKKLRQTW